MAGISFFLLYLIFFATLWALGVPFIIRGKLKGDNSK
jgi:hypothetical protein